MWMLNAYQSLLCLFIIPPLLVLICKAVRSSLNYNAYNLPLS